MVIEYNLVNGLPTATRKVFDTFAQVEEYLHDEHYSEGICPRYITVASDDDGLFTESLLLKLERALI